MITLFFCFITNPSNLTMTYFSQKNNNKWCLKPANARYYCVLWGLGEILWLNLIDWQRWLSRWTVLGVLSNTQPEIAQECSPPWTWMRLKDKSSCLVNSTMSLWWLVCSKTNGIVNSFESQTIVCIYSFSAYQQETGINTTLHSNNKTLFLWTYSGPRKYAN